MIFSVGQLHSSIRMIEIASATPVNSNSILQEMGTVIVCPADSVLNLCLRCNWLEIATKGLLKITRRGEVLLAQTNYENRLREQLVDIISLRPTWASNIKHGRREFNRNVPADVSQCFREAGMMYEPLNDTIIAWWDRLSILVRGYRNEELLGIGRRGERLSMDYEKKRTGSQPYWQSIETNFSGYDILSSVSSADSTSLQIEVKASEIGMNSAVMHVTANEWRAAQSAMAFKFHLWLLKDNPRLAVLDINDVEPHIPDNRGDGKWSDVQIKYSTFSGKFLEIKQ